MIHMYSYIYIYMIICYILYNYIYIYIERERERCIYGYINNKHKSVAILAQAILVAQVKVRGVLPVQDQREEKYDG